jgi:hypothetical protein
MNLKRFLTAVIKKFRKWKMSSIRMNSFKMLFKIKSFSKQFKRMPAKAINLLNFSKTTSSSLMERIKFSNKVPIYINLVNSNIQMKQSELAKMSDLEGKMKVIF